MARAYTTYNPLRVFGSAGLLLAIIGLVPILRFLWFVIAGDSSGHIQSLVIGGAVLLLGAITFLLGILADLISANRKLAEAALEKLRKLEAQILKDDENRTRNEAVADDAEAGSISKRSNVAS